MRHNERPQASERATCYDFDEWTRNHYAETLKKDQAARSARKEAEDRQCKDNGPLYTDPHDLVFSKAIFLMSFGMILLACIYEYSGLFNVHDVPIPISPEVAIESIESRKKRAFFKPFFS